MNRQITVFVGCLIKDDRVLLVQRDEKDCPEAHLKWELPGGKVDFGESPQQSLKREFLEETGILVKVKDLVPLVQTKYWQYKWGIQQTFVFCYHCAFVEAKKLKKTDHHVRQIRWLKLEDIKNMPTLAGTNKFVDFIRGKE